MTGYMSQRVLGQYELSLLGAATRRRGCSFVAPNLTAPRPSSAWTARASCAGSRSTSWSTRSSSGRVPWLRGHLGELLREYLATVEVRIDSGAAGGLPSLPDLGASSSSASARAGWPPWFRAASSGDILDRVQAAMAVVEGHAEHLMDALGAGARARPRGPARGDGRAAARSRSAPERILMRLLGMDIKMRQYELGKASATRWSPRAGSTLLNRVWDAAGVPPDAGRAGRPGRSLGDAPVCNPRHVMVYKRVFGGIQLPTLDLIRLSPTPEVPPEGEHPTHHGYSDPHPAQGRARKAAATRKRNSTAAKAKRTQQRTAKSTAETGTQAGVFTVEAVAQQAERAVLIPVGAALVARDAVVDATKPYTNRETAERELTKLQRQVRTDLRKFERRGNTARNRVRREVKKARTRASASCVSAAPRPRAW